MATFAKSWRTRMKEAPDVPGLPRSYTRSYKSPERPGRLLRQALNDEGSELADLIACRESILLTRIVTPRLHLFLAVKSVDTETI